MVSPSQYNGGRYGRYIIKINAALFILLSESQSHTKSLTALSLFHKHFNKFLHVGNKPILYSLILSLTFLFRDTEESPVQNCLCVYGPFQQSADALKTE